MEAIPTEDISLESSHDFLRRSRTIFVPGSIIRVRTDNRTPAERFTQGTDTEIPDDTYRIVSVMSKASASDKNGLFRIKAIPLSFSDHWGRRPERKSNWKNEEVILVLNSEGILLSIE
jgi:hypothetical protein